MQTKKRVRGTLLVLLWFWAITVFVTLDLFKNVREFDGIRPRAQLYRGMRIAAHKMIGEPLDDGGASASDPITVATRQTLTPAARLAEELERVRKLDDWVVLNDYAANAEDSRVRIVALRSLARRFGPAARSKLLQAARDRDERPTVRKQAARFLGRTGLDADKDLKELLGSEHRLEVRAGAVLGLGELGTAAATERLLAYAAEANWPLRSTALQAIAGIRNPQAAALLREAALENERRTDARTAACIGLARMKEPATARALGDVLADSTNPTDLRATAANSLGRLGHVEALPVVKAARTDATPEIARHARLATTRLKHLRTQ